MKRKSNQIEVFCHDEAAFVFSGLPEDVSRNAEVVFLFNPPLYTFLVPLLYPILSQVERAKSQRFRFDVDRNNYIICHGILRTLIGRYLNRAPETIEFGERFNKKPFLIGDSLYFNLSHTKEAAAIGFSMDQEIGVDVEKIKPDFDCQSVADISFSTEEKNQLNKSRYPNDYFFLVWTRKEALLKVTGIGLIADLQEINVALGINKFPRHALQELNMHGRLSHSYHIHSQKMGDHYISVAVASRKKITLVELDLASILGEDNSLKV